MVEVRVHENILLRKKNYAVRYDKRREFNLVSEQFVIFQDGICYFMKCVILKLQEIATNFSAKVRNKTR
jgi:hypothetical protein